MKGAVHEIGAGGRTTVVQKSDNQRLEEEYRQRQEQEAAARAKSARAQGFNDEQIRDIERHDTSNRHSGGYCTRQDGRRVECSECPNGVKLHEEYKINYCR
jgi:hypothetical protein